MYISKKKKNFSYLPDFMLLLPSISKGNFHLLQHFIKHLWQIGNGGVYHLALKPAKSAPRRHEINKFFHYFSFLCQLFSIWLFSFLSKKFTSLLISISYGPQFCFPLFKFSVYDSKPHCIACNNSQLQFLCCMFQRKNYWCCWKCI